MDSSPTDETPAPALLVPPSHRQVLADNLHFLRRVPDYYTEKEFGDLPIDIANSMTVGGGGGGTYFKSWSGFVDRNTD